MQTQSLAKNVDVLIVGAGPSGLMMACQLALHNISFRIIDKKDQRINFSGALIVQARSLEIFQQMGIATEAIQGGRIANEIKLIFNGKKSFTIPVRDIGHGLTQFPWLLLLEQSKTEQLLTDFIHNLGFSVERGTELVRFSQDDYCVAAFLKLPDGGEEFITAKYLIGADGAHSAVRRQLQIPFVGKTCPIPLFVSDCKAGLDLSSDQLCFSFSDAATVGFFPLPGGQWRIDGTLSGELGTNDSLTFSDVGKSFADTTRMNIKIAEPGWFSAFRVNERYALSFQEKRCFLVGDAAHVHSPVGAQGMNTGLQDSYNLAWKLAFVIQGKAKATLHDTYSSERVAVARNVVSGTERVFTMVTSQNVFAKLFRVHILPYILQIVLPLLNKFQVIRHFFFLRISEIGIRYRKNSFLYDASFGDFPGSAPKPGDRLPYTHFQENGLKLNIQDKVKSTAFHLFIFTKQSSPASVMKVAENYRHLISVETIPFSSGTGELFKRLGIADSGYYLVRPDLYIAYRSVKPGADHFESFLQQFFFAKK